MQFTLAPGIIIKSPTCIYEIISVLGSGGFGITYLVKAIFIKDNSEKLMALKEHFLSDVCERDEQTHHVIFSKPVAKKVMSSMRDFMNEAKRLSKLKIDNKNLIHIYESFQCNNTAYYSMEYIKGRTLQKYVEDKGGLSEDETVNLILPIARALSILHSNGLTHLDIKPANILLREDGHNPYPVLIDFGLTKHYDGRGLPTSTIITQGYSEGYSPREQYLGINTFSPSADVYSLAATTLFCLTGHRPPSALSLNDDDLDRLISSNTSSKLKNLIKISMAGKASLRPSDASSFINLYNKPSQLTRVIDQSDSKTVEIKTHKRFKSLLKWMAVATVCIAFAAIILKFGLSHNSEDQDSTPLTELEKDTLLQKLDSIAIPGRLAVNYRDKEYYVTNDIWNNLRQSEKEKITPKGIVSGKESNLYIISLEDGEGDKTWDNAMTENNGNLPYYWMAKDILKNLEQINQQLTTFGGQPIIGNYWTRSLSASNVGNNNSAEFFCTERNSVESEFADSNHYFSVRSVTPIAKDNVVPTSFKLSPSNLDLALYYNCRPYFISRQDYANLDSDIKGKIKKVGVVIGNSNPFVIDLYDQKSSYTLLDAFKFDLPSKSQFEKISNNLNSIQQALIAFGGEKLQETCIYWSGDRDYDSSGCFYALSVWEGGGSSIESWVDENEESVREAHHI